MIDYAAFLKDNNCGVLASLDDQGMGIRTGVIEFLFGEGNKMFFCTSDGRPLFKRVTANPMVSFCVNLPDYSTVLSINGKVVFVDDLELKQRALDSLPQIKRAYKTADNPVFKVYYIDVEFVDTFDFENGPQTFMV